MPTAESETAKGSVARAGKLLLGRSIALEPFGSVPPCPMDRESEHPQGNVAKDVPKAANRDVGRSLDFNKHLPGIGRMVPSEEYLDCRIRFWLQITDDEVKLGLGIEPSIDDLGCGITGEGPGPRLMPSA